MIAPPDHIPDYRRLSCLYATIVLMLSLIVIRLWYLQIVKGPDLAEQSETRRTRLIRRLAARGTVTDSDGEVLATSRFRFVVKVIPEEVEKNSTVLPKLASILHISETDLADRIDQPNYKPFEAVPVEDNADINLLTQIEEQQLDLPGVLISKDPERYYVDNQLCTHVLGITGRINPEEYKRLKESGYHADDTVGTEGLERTMEADLRGRDGGQVVAVNAHGRLLENLEEMKPIPGHTIRLTLKRSLQKAAYDALKEEFDHTGHPGSAVAIDPNDGAVLALVSFPSYDLNNYRQNVASLLKDGGRPLINRAIASRYPVGSTFKLVTAAAGLQSGAITPETREDCPGYLKLGNHIFHCDKRSGHGLLALADAIGQSCDVFFWRVAQAVDIDKLTEWEVKFGLGEKTGIDLPGEVKGLVPTPDWKLKHRHEVWYRGDLLLTSIGQGFVGVTPIQLADYTAALANGGTLWKPQIVRRVTDPSVSPPAVVRELVPSSRGELGLSPQNRDAIVEGMRRALKPMGTAYGCAIAGLEVAGKTGTAQVNKFEDNSVFVCFAPVDHPRIAIAVLVEKGGHGSDVAAPIARRMLLNYFSIKEAGEGVPIGRKIGND